MLELATVLVGLGGVYGLVKIWILKGNLLKPSIVEKLGDTNAKIAGTLMSLVMIVLAILLVFSAFGQ